MCLIYIIAIFIGGARFGFFGALIAAALVHLIFAQIKPSFSFNSQDRNKREAIFVETLFSLMGALAKADGVISQAEINHAEALISKMNMSSEHRNAAINHFRQGADKNFDIQAQLQAFNAICGNANNLKRLLLGHLINTAMADGSISNSERDMLRQIGLLLGFNTAILDILFNQSSYQFNQGQNSYQQYQQAHNQQQSTDNVAKAYAALGINASATDAQVKRAYRKLMSANHPDKLMGQGMPADMIELATQKSQQIQSAYELIKKIRGIN